MGDEYLFEMCHKFARDPLGFAEWCWTWGSGDLTGHQLEPMQRELFASIRDKLADIPDDGDWECVIREALSTGHGPGKSAALAMLSIWGLSTFPGCRGVITANTETQLRSKTAPELALWWSRSVVKHWFTVTPTAIYHKHDKTGTRIDLIPWSEHRSEGFAGLHNTGKRTLVLFDEASAISDSIWEVVSGATTDRGTEIIWVVLGNPTRRDGQFADIFRNQSHRWTTRHVDARSSRLANQTLIEEWRQDHGEDSNFFRVRVKGLFPTQDADSLFDELWIRRALERKPQWEPEDVGILACDVARKGKDSTVIGYRRGMTYTEVESYVGKDLMKTTGRLKRHYDEGRKDGPEMPVCHIILDDVGLGGGVTDRLMEQDVDVRPFLGGEGAHDPKHFRNRRDEAWWNLRELFRKDEITLYDIDDPEGLIRELTMLTYDYHSSGRTEIESKKQAKKRTKQSSPDHADCLTMAFYPSSFESIMAGLS